MTPGVLELIETLRPLITKGDGGAFRVARDAAADVGCRLRVLRSRSVPVKKGNRLTKLNQQNGGTIIIASPPGPANGLRPGDWIVIDGRRFEALGHYQWQWASDRIFAFDVDEDRRSIEWSVPYIMGVDMGAITITPGPAPLPGPPKTGRVPGHVAAHRPRLDGRRR